MSDKIDNSLLEVTLDDLPDELRTLVERAMETHKLKCLMSFSKNKSGKVFQRTNLPRVLLPHQTDHETEEEEERKYSEIMHRVMHEAMTNHNTTFLNTFRAIMVGIFGPAADAQFGTTEGPIGPTYFNPPKQSSGDTGTSGSGDGSRKEGNDGSGNLPKGASEPNATGAGNTGTTTHGQATFGTTGEVPSSAYKISPAAPRLQKTATGYHPFIDYSSLNAIPNPGYGSAGYKTPGAPKDSVDVIMDRMADMMKNQFGLKIKGQTHTYRSPYPEWYNSVALPPRVKVPTDFIKFSGLDDTSTVEHISRYLMQLGEASTDNAWRVRYFPLSLTGPAFTWFSSLPPNSVITWEDLEQKFHSYFYTGTNEKKLVDLANLKQKANETPLEFLRRFRETKNLCYALNLPDDQLPGMAISGMQPAVREKLFGMEFEDLGQLSQRLALMNTQAQGFRRESRFQQKNNAVVDIYQAFLDEAGEYEDEDEVAAAELTWAKEPVQVNPRWMKQQKGTYDFDVTKADKLFELLLKEGRIKLPEGHPMLRPDGVKDKKYCGFHNARSHSINDCRVFRQKIQKAIQEGHLNFNSKMKIDGQPFPQNMVSFSLNMVSADKGKGKMKVLTSDRAKESGSVDPNRQITNEELLQKAQFQNSRTEKGESSRPRVTSRILLNKWQRQQEKEQYQRRRMMEDRLWYEQEMYREEQKEYEIQQEQSHWGCAFFRHCWNEGLKLPTRYNCPECSDQYTRYRQDRTNRRSVHDRLGFRLPENDRRLKINDKDDYRKRYS
jgi:hypothetical protein